jgi:hypothetical protein
MPYKEITYLGCLYSQNQAVRGSPSKNFCIQVVYYLVLLQTTPDSTEGRKLRADRDDSPVQFPGNPTMLANPENYFFNYLFVLNIFLLSAFRPLEQFFSSINSFHISRHHSKPVNLWWSREINFLVKYEPKCPAYSNETEITCAGK